MNVAHENRIAIVAPSARCSTQDAVPTLSLPDSALHKLLEAQAQSAYLAAQTFYVLTGDFDQMSAHLRALEQIEHQADMLTHDVTNTVNTQGVSTIDRQDMHGLTTQLDDITDAIESAASRMGLYRLQKPRPDLQTLVGLLVAITQETKRLVSRIALGFDHAEVTSVIGGIHALETRSDRAFRQALTDLFEDNSLECRQLIKWKDVYERIETAINRCEKLAGFIEALTIKYTGVFEQTRSAD